MPQLDGLRAFSFFAVAYSHWMPPEYQLGIPWGTGVQLFFVISGFLITGILLRNRPDTSGAEIGSALKAFYMRRILRIFPLYYGVLAVCLLLGVGPINVSWPWHVTYMSNAYYSWNEHPGSLVDPYLHFWSLAVEEQFYIFWPFLALMASRRSLYGILCSAIGASLLFRVFSGHQWDGSEAIRYLTPCCLDALGAGSLLAYARHYHGLAGMQKMKRNFAIIGLVGLVLMVPLGQLTGQPEARWIGHTFLVIFYGAIVAQAAEGFAGMPGRVLNLKPVRYLGKISYGLYVYHFFAAYALTGLLRRAGLGDTVEQQFPYNIVAYASATVAVAIVSWHVYEVSFHRLKRWFSYPRNRRPIPQLPTEVATSTRPA